MTVSSSRSEPDVSTHPLDLLPLFRRWPSSPLRDLLYTALWNCCIALVLTLVNKAFTAHNEPFSYYWWPMLLISNIVGYLIHGSQELFNRLLGGWPSRAKGLQRRVYYIALISCCVVVGVSLGLALLRGKSPLRYLLDSSMMSATLPFAIFVALFMALVVVLGERRIVTETLAARQAEQIAATGRLLAEARLRALQAQIEPHFLYNTLANVVSLIEVKPALARRMLERFIDYLRASLAASRAEQATLGAEADMVAAYLDVLAVRMGERLRYRIDIADELRQTPLAPMLLQPLVENAIAHGLEPKVEGGEVLLSARLADGKLCLQVSDTGAGLGAPSSKPGGGVGLSNIRARLASLYGDGAQVQLLENQPCGLTVRLLLPLNTEPSSTIPAP
ncbi:sensor histidine kinase [Rugamonas sp. CCM 8940]|uniref:sensor histidine kinase n=1 Tax=Rugamonas sp. CCM 8940 TaxID=2765359 RepID=UPI0018F6F919|nr:histidine kinase [Rugamonas sp. CCM 8940]MBJ7310451.1 histidine kinase [Rugamonas sp. CCM 8940]